MRGDTTVTANSESTHEGEKSRRCTRTDNVFEALQFPCDERAGGPCYRGAEDRDDGSKRKKKGTYGMHTRRRGDTCLRADFTHGHSDWAVEDHEPLSAVNWPSFWIEFLNEDGARLKEPSASSFILPMSACSDTSRGEVMANGLSDVRLGE